MWEFVHKQHILVEVKSLKNSLSSFIHLQANLWKEKNVVILKR